MRFARIVLASLLVTAASAYASDVYKVTVTRKGQDLYEIQGSKAYVKTRYCYEYVYFDEAILRVDSTAGYSIGKIIFSNNSTCDVESILKS